MTATMKTELKQSAAGSIPSDWNVCCLGDVADVIGGGTPSTSVKEYWTPPEIEWVTAKDVSKSQTAKIQTTEKRISKFGLKNCSARILPSLTTVIIARGATMGKCKMLSHKMAMNQTCYGIVSRDKIDPVYLYYRLSNMYDHFQASAHGSIFNTVISSGLRSLPLALPNIAEQQRIAKTLCDLDDTIEINQRMNKTLEQIAQAIFKHWFIDFEFPNEEGKPYKSSGGEMTYNEQLGKQIPIAWKVRKISEICSTQYGYTGSATDIAEGPKLLRVTDINKYPWINWNTVPYCKIDDESLKRYKLSIGDVLVSRMADPGKVAIMEENTHAVFASYLIRLKTQSLARSYFLYYFMRSELYQKYVRGAKSGSVQFNMNAKVITASEIFEPPRNLIDKFLMTILPSRNRISLNLQQSSTLALIRESLLPRLMSGKTRVPAEVA